MSTATRTVTDSITPESFGQVIARVTGSIAGRSLDRQLQHDLNRRFPPKGIDFEVIFQSCQAAIAAGWMCNRDAGGIKYGRVIKPGPVTHGFSVDVVDMPPLAGPHHAHPNGEIDMIMPLEAGAAFDGSGAGWLVYEPASAHRPTVTTGRALVLYLLPGGAIEFTRS
ncbi:MAG TPA: DUF4863 family protein [Steroidobacteraceae bacterium]|nr:DUF4863 family protein [Steroidobacteraceae bacterium]